jgi:hypothetical protein
MPATASLHRINQARYRLHEVTRELKEGKGKDERGLATLTTVASSSGEVPHMAAVAESHNVPSPCDIGYHEWVEELGKAMAKLGVVDLGAKVRRRAHTMAAELAATAVALFSASACTEGGRRNEWRGELWTSWRPVDACDLTGGTAAGVRAPPCVHAASTV